jgi:arsenate reductase
MKSITIYQKPTCSTCRQAVGLIKESGIPYVAVNYYDTPFTKTRLKILLKKAGLSPGDALRKKEEIYKKLDVAEKNLSDDELLDLMVKYPDLIQRPLVERGDTALLARPADTVKQIF